ncbi:MAG: UvrD-helicase domain-containing protein, partial [Anaerolineales bacterium]|nr:UvrD-helicase domain-containing protein [Anaerolineales bacterium]
MDMLTGLNPRQLQAVTAPADPTLVLAGPGSGKTRVLTQRVVYLISEGVPTHRILAVTFTNRSAREMRQRIERQLAGNIRGLNVGTFHATCARLLRREAKHLLHSQDFVIYDSADQRALVKQAMAYHSVDTTRFQPVRIHSTISTAKNELTSPSEFRRDSYYHEIVGRVYESYQHQLRENNALDFDDLLMETVRLLQRESELRERYQHNYGRILVDEFQDTNLAQYTLLQLLSGEHRQLFVVGDPDQSIYRWRGADYRNVGRFRQDYPEATVVILEQNYRSTQTILNAATAVINQNRGRTVKELFTDRRGGNEIQLHEAYDEEEEAG